MHNIAEAEECMKMLGTHTQAGRVFQRTVSVYRRVCRQELWETQLSPTLFSPHLFSQFL